MEAIKKIEINKVIKIILITVLGTLLLTVSAKIKVPFYPVPMTMQTLIVLLIGTVFGWKLGLATITLYLFEGMIGLPVFAGTPEKGVGLTYFMGPTMGYLIGFLPAVFFAGLLKINYKYNLIHRFIMVFILYTFSVSFIYFFGLIWLLNFVSIEKVWLVGAAPFMLAELLKISILSVFVTSCDKTILSWRSLR
ncbi:MAG: biotin transport system substrate-specific component [Pelagibacterales bacterium]|nr:biotin transport system substrate-specific component [Pelagibacterales bacterium]